MLQSPTGGGKTVMAFDILSGVASKGNRAILYTHRTMLFEQLLDRLRAGGFSPCVRAPRYRSPIDTNICLAMIQTDYTRSFKNDKTDKYQADVVIVDECHAHKGKQMKEINEYYEQRGATIIGLSATPVDVGHLYDDIVTAGTFSELLSCGLHLPVEMYAPDEPDLSNVAKARGEYQVAGMARQYQPHLVCGSIIKTYNKLNPERKPGLLFAPSVPGSRSLASYLSGRGIRTAHIDGYNAVLPDGTEVRSSRMVRDDVVASLVNGDIDLISNRFVLREGIDIPELYYGVLCTTFGMTSYIQACGRFLRNHKSLTHVRLADHGGNYWRHGYINIDRQWDITQPAHRQPAEDDGLPKGWRCPNCFHVEKSEGKCANCGHVITKPVRAVRQLDGTLKLINPSQGPSPQAVYDSYFYKIRNAQTNMPFWVFADWFMEKTGYAIDRSGDETLIIARDGARERLRNVPPPDSNAWRLKVSDTSARLLQH